ncbi:MAG: PEGA domain-containing protein [Thiolinea sp.]
MSIKLLAAIAGVILTLSGCATVTRGTEEALVIESEPSGAQVKLSNGMTGTTPTSFKVKRKDNLIVTVSKQGYETASINVTSQVAGAGGAAMAGNVLVGGIIGAAVDASTGAMNELKPNPVKITLNRK